MNRALPEPDPPPESYIIDVCATCGRKATFPFCVHWSAKDRWTYPLVVAPTAAARRGLIAQMRGTRS